MAAVAAFAATAFAAVKTAAAAITAVKVLGLTVATWGKVAMWTAMGASMLMKPPGLPSSGTQVNLQPAGADAALPIIFGRTAVQGFITYREAYPDAVHNSDKNNKLGFETVVSVGPIRSISNYSLTGHQIIWDRDPTRPGSQTGVSICRAVQGFDPKSSMWKDGVRAAFCLGEHTDHRTLRDITGDNVPGITPAHKMSGLARIVQVYELDGSKNLRFSGGFPDAIQAIVEGVYAWNPRLDSTYPGGLGPQRIDQPDTWGWSDNPYICGLAWCLGRKGPTGHKMWGIGALPEDIDIPAFVHGANVADLNGWKIGGMITTDDSKDAVLSNILVCGAGQYLAGPQISVFVNEPKVSTFTLRQSDLIGDQVIRATRTMRNRVNRILVKYREPNQNSQIVTGQEVTDAGYVEADGGLRTTETTYPLIQNATQAHQIGAYELVNSREYEIDVKTTAEALSVKRGDLITLDFAVGAIEGQDFIVKSWSFDAQSQIVSMTLVSETAGKHDFALGRTVVAPAPAKLKSTAALNPSAPGADEWSIIANQIVQTRPVDDDGETILPVTTPAFVLTGGAREPSIKSIVVETRDFDPNRDPNDDDGWNVMFEAASHSERIVISDVAPLTAYDVAISYRSSLGVISPRLVFGGATTGALSFDWNDDVIVGRPPALTDLIGGKIKAEFIALEGEVDRSLKDALDDLDRAQGDLKDAQDEVEQTVRDGLAAKDAAINDAKNAANSALDLIGRDDTKGLRNRIKIIEETGPDGTLVGRIELLEDIGANHETRILNVTTSQTNFEGTTAQNLATINTALTTERGKIDGAITRLDQVKATADGAATASALAAVALTQTNEKTRLDGQVTRLDQVKATADGAATASALAAVALTQTNEKTRLDGQVTRLDQVKATADGAATASALAAVALTQTNEKTRLDGQVTRLDQVKATADGAATASALAAVALTQTNEKTRLDGQVTRLDQVKTTADNAATASALAAVALTQTNEKTRLDGQVTRLDQVKATADGAATASALSTVALDVANEKVRLTGQITRLDQVKVTADGAATVAALNQLGVTVNGFDTRITSAQSIAASADGKVNAMWSMSANVNGLISGIKSENNGTKSTLDFMATRTRFVSDDGQNAVAALTVEGNRVVMQNAVFRGQLDVQSSPTGPRLKIDNQLIQIYDANRLRVRLGIW